MNMTFVKSSLFERILFLLTKPVKLKIPLLDSSLNENQDWAPILEQILNQSIIDQFCIWKREVEIKLSQCNSIEVLIN